MIIPADLLQDVNEAVFAKHRIFLKPEILLAVCQKESSNVGIFTERDQLLQLNIAHAVRFIPHAQDRQIANAFRIDRGPLKGNICKFRCEPAYWKWVEGLEFADDWSLEQRIRLCASVGVGQMMTRNIVAAKGANGEYVNAPAKWDNIIKVFMSSRPMQLLYAAGMLEQLLKRAHDFAKTDKDATILALSRYNAGPASGITAYGRSVYEMIDDFAREIPNVGKG